MHLTHPIGRGLHRLSRRMYRGGRPGPVTRIINRLTALQYSAGVLSPRYTMTLEVAGRRTGRPVMLPVVVAAYGGDRYLVSMLGSDVNWVRNARAADGRAVLHRRGSHAVALEEIAPGERAPILRRYLDIAPGARPHFPIDRRATPAEFAAVADRYPVFRIHAV
ncbi:hypothetical protein [Rhodococcus sp. NPDC058639]|uniref:hypothetical protein n=1 Tax=Rhodococcus sp. NPDC058639 TaxID=3346570 RepID=UPI0036484C73